MITLSLFDIFMFLLRAVRWTLLLAGIAFAGGGVYAGGPTDFNGYLEMAPTAERRRGEQLVARLLGRDEAEVRRNLSAASPARWVTADDAPFFTAHGTRDELVPFAQATTLHAALGKAGVENHLVAMEGAGHGFSSDELNRRVLRFFDKHLHGKPAEIPTGPIRIR